LFNEEALRVSFHPAVIKSEEIRRLVFYSHVDNLLNRMMRANTALYVRIVDDPSFHTMSRENMFDTVSKAIQQLSR